MNTERETKTAAKRTGRRHGTVEELLTGEAGAPEARTQLCRARPRNPHCAKPGGDAPERGV